MKKTDQTTHTSQPRNDLSPEPRSAQATIRAARTALAHEKSKTRLVENELERSYRKVQEISKRALSALEADRKSISKDLHDSIGTSLAAIKFSLETKMDQMPEEFATSLQIVVDHLAMAIKETKRISAKLRPMMLDDLGLLATINWYVREFRKLNETITLETFIDLDEELLAEGSKIIIYRILQEALTNAAKHSGADQVTIELSTSTRQGQKSIILIVTDNGRGFDCDHVRSTEDPLSGYGLQGMEERAEIFGGRLEILSSVGGGGTSVRLELPAK